MPELTLNIENGDFKFKEFIIFQSRPINQQQTDKNFFKTSFTNMIGNDFVNNTYLDYNILSSIKSFMAIPTDKCSFDYILIYKKPKTRTLRLRVKSSSGEESNNYFNYLEKNLCLTTISELKLWLDDNPDIELFELKIKYDCSKISTSVDDDGLRQKNTNLYNAVRTIIPLPYAVPLVVDLDIHDYYIFLTTLFVLDPYHDFRRGFRNTKKCTKYCKNKSELTTLKEIIKVFLKSKLEQLQNEYISLGGNPELFQGLNGIFREGGIWL